MNTLKVRNFSFIEDLDIAALTFAAIERIEGLAATVNGGIKLWVRRSAERRLLAQMSYHMLDDIGLTVADVEKEAAKFFWQK
ncbi:MAG: DUF1127 domain-containing protein [Gammaproteobacteria bacterium]|jgi:uncharacterized protein YjiS (DUF1127 family)|nr:DUF1127 domain-containing protein [Gammaproteobacteria bacterium]HUV23628.1 DUF1127 domain-containing protein [Gammaproteobacteria bacterium]